MAQIVYQPAVDGDRPIIEQIFPDGNITTTQVDVSIIDKSTDTAVTIPVMSAVSCDLNDNGGSPDTIVRQDAGDFTTDGFTVGMGVRVSNAATAGNNNLTGPGYVITVITASTMTFVTGTLSGTDAGDTITITAGAAFRSTIDNTIWLFDTQNIADDAVSGGIDLENTIFEQLLISFTSTLSTGGTIKRRQTLVVNGSGLAQSKGLYNAEVFIDVTNGSAGTTFPIGTSTSPVDNITDAKTIADTLFIRRYVINGSITLDADHTDWEFDGHSSALHETVNFGGFDVTNSGFESLTVTGAMGGSIAKNVSFKECRLDTVTGFDGVAIESAILTSLTLAAGGTALLSNVSVITTSGNINANGASTIKWVNASGGLINILNFAAGGTLEVQWNGALALIGASNTGGTITMGGFAIVSTAASGMTVTVDQTLNRSVLGDLPWDEILSGHLAAGTTGEKLDSLGSAADTADAVWDESTAGHETGGTFGEKVSKKLLDFAKWIALKPPDPS